MAEHQPPPWRRQSNAFVRPILVDAKGNRVLMTPANIDRIAACVNVCHGVENVEGCTLIPRIENGERKGF